MFQINETLILIINLKPEGDKMNNEIKIQKTTGLLLVGLLLAVVVGGYLVFGAGSNAGQTVGTPQPPAENQPGTTNQPSSTGENVQEVYLKATASGYDKSEIVVKKGVPVKLHFTAQNAGCGSYLVIYGLNEKVLSKNGQEGILEFTPQQEGSYEYNCGMRMFKGGKLVVTA